MTAAKKPHIALVPSIADRMHALFAGYERAHGTHGEPDWDETNGKWKIRRTAMTVKEPITVAMWEQHLAGTRPLGTVPVRGDGTCKWISIDDDRYDENPLAIVDQVKRSRLPLVACRSKSGGTHLFGFFSEPVPASDARALAAQFARQLGIGGAEIFPKQDHHLGADSSGSWICMPYLGTTFGGKIREQVGLKPMGAEMLVEEFLAAGEGALISPERLAEMLRVGGGSRSRASGPTRDAPVIDDPDGPLADGPPCLQTLAHQGIGPGIQNKTLFNIGVYLKKKYPDDWEDHLDDANRELLAPRGSAEGLTSVKRSLRRKDYQYTCKEVPLCDHCNSKVCRTRPHGVGDGDTGDLPILEIVKWTSRPPTWSVRIDDDTDEGAWIEQIETEKFTDLKAFNNLVFERTNTRLALTQKEWNTYLGRIRDKIVPREPKPETGDDAIFHELLSEFLTNRYRGDKVDDLQTGKPYLDADDGVYCFRLPHLWQFIQSHNHDFAKNKKRSWCVPHIEALGGFYNRDKPKTVTKPDGTKTTVKFWSIPSDKITPTTERPVPRRRDGGLA